MSGLTIRPYAAGDAPVLGQVYHRAVHEGAAGHYDADQRRAWSPAPPDDAEWEAKLERVDCVVAERDGAAVGFMSMDMGAGHLELAFVLPAERRRGTADALYAVLEGRARAAGLSGLTVDASALAERFFARRGWSVASRELAERHGVLIPRARMEKRLSAGQAA
ncbi:GNAT family N-acetyltransferase [Rhodobacterales bacterium HKCCE2091]|nr:GNAT family N-acetyltransferase [Rhodobacterales bacterium HKCCE2091]